MRILVVGAGFTGASAARVLADAGHEVLVVDTRPHIAGNAYDERSPRAGGYVSRYGPHLFHTNSKKVLDFLSRFTNWRPYEHRVRAALTYGGVKPPTVALPITMDTVSHLTGVTIDTPDQMREVLESERIDLGREPANSREMLYTTVGPRITLALFEGYTQKQWGMSLSELDASVVKRIPIRFNNDDRYFTDEYQCMPVAGYTRMFELMLTSKNIRVQLSCPYSDRLAQGFDCVLHTGCIDEFYGHSLGKLGYRSLKFEFRQDGTKFGTDMFSKFDYLTDQENVGTINFPDPDIRYTRITNYNIINGLKSKMPVLCREVPSAEGEPYYPIPTKQFKDLYNDYLTYHQHRLDRRETNVVFCGRLGSFQYLNMDQACAQGMHVANKIIEGDTRVDL